jgi:hypothetical protein
LTTRYQSDPWIEHAELGEHEAGEDEQRAGDLDELVHGTTSRMRGTGARVVVETGYDAPRPGRDRPPLPG